LEQRAFAAGTTRNAADTAVPDVTVNFNGKFGDVAVFAAVQQYNVNETSPATSVVNTDLDESYMRFTLGAAMAMGDLGLKAALTQDDKDLAVSVAASMKLSDQLRANLVVEQTMMDADNSDYTSIWVNAFYKLPSGWEWGAEVQVVSADDFGVVNPTFNAAGTVVTGGQADSDMVVRLQAKYAF
jgi:hypothetical protein